LFAWIRQNITRVAEEATPAGTTPISSKPSAMVNMRQGILQPFWSAQFEGIPKEYIAPDRSLLPTDNFRLAFNTSRVPKDRQI
jgi:hypothetical protein